MGDRKVIVVLRMRGFFLFFLGFEEIDGGEGYYFVFCCWMLFVDEVLAVFSLQSFSFF